MVKNTVDSRVRRTKKLLRQGLTELMAKKSIKKITVRELSELVDINRGTFYLHYKDIYDLVEQIETELFDEFESILMSYTLADISKRPHQVIADICAFFEKNHDICTVLLSDNGDLDFIHKLREFIRAKCRKDITDAYHIENLKDYEFLYVYFESGVIGVLRHWLLHPETQKTPDDIATIIENLLVNGISGFALNDSTLTDAGE